MPLGYDVSDRKLVINAEEAERVRVIFERYRALGCVSNLQEELEQRGIRSKQRVLASSQVLGGGSFGRGALYHLLQNRVYLGEVVHKGVSYPGEHERIIDEELWSAVQARLLANRGVRRRSRLESGSLLTGLITDAGGNLMSPTYSAHRDRRYRYYVSRLLVLGGRKERSHCRVGAEDLERLVVEVLAQQLSRPELLSEASSGSWSAAIQILVREHIERVVVDRREVQIIRKVTGLTSRSGEADGHGDTPKVYRAQLPAPQPRARKEIIIPGEPTARRVNHGLILAIARAKRWMQGLCDGTYHDTDEIARHFKLNDAHVRRLLRFGYLAPDIVEAIVEGRQPRALTVRRLLKGIPCAWADQRKVFGFAR